MESLWLTIIDCDSVELHPDPRRNGHRTLLRTAACRELLPVELLNSTWCRTSVHGPNPTCQAGIPTTVGAESSLRFQDFPAEIRNMTYELILEDSPQYIQRKQRGTKSTLKRSTQKVFLKAAFSREQRRQGVWLAEVAAASTEAPQRKRPEMA